MGTMKFASINAHAYKTLSMRDDLESLGYTLLYLVAGPESFWFKSESIDQKYFLGEKTKFLKASNVNPNLLVI
jgi:hypothetical protein